MEAQKIVLVTLAILFALALVVALGVGLWLWSNSPQYYEQLTHHLQSQGGPGASVYGTATQLPLVPQGPPSRIAVLMVATPEIHSYASHAIEQNQEWAQRHNYHMVHKTHKHPQLGELPINFSKIQYALDLLETQKYDYVVYLDADAIVHNLDYDIRNLIHTYMTHTYSILFGEDCYSKENCSKPGRINSGVFVVRNNATGRNILRTWRDKSLGSCNAYVDQFPNCQLIFTNCVAPLYPLGVRILPFNTINGFGDSLLVKHTMAMDDVERTAEIKKHLQTQERITVF